jgi:uncharacterized membrane protein YqjE
LNVAIWELRGERVKNSILLEKTLRNLEKNREKRVSDTKGFRQ